MKTRHKGLFKLTTATAALALIVALAFAAFKPVEKNIQQDDFYEWYAITIASGQNPDQPQHQIISKTPINEPPQTDSLNCAQFNAGVLCAVRIKVPEANYEFEDQYTMQSLPQGTYPADLEARHPDE